MKLVAVTSCPTGIAHSQMAAENLEQTAKELGHDVSVEVQGAMGTQDELTAEEIAAADAVVIAADTSVKRDRFEDTPLVKATVKDAVNDAEGLVREATELAGSGSADEADDADAKAEPDSEAKADRETEPADHDETASQRAGTARRGGDRSKGLFARLKRLLS
jgi:PTS system fructose-specific IIB component